MAHRLDFALQQRIVRIPRARLQQGTALLVPHLHRLDLDRHVQLGSHLVVRGLLLAGEEEVEEGVCGGHGCRCLWNPVQVKSSWEGVRESWQGVGYETGDAV